MCPTIATVGPSPVPFTRAVTEPMTSVGTSATGAHASANANDYDCAGHIQAGTPAPGDDDTQVQYVFACGGPITGYQILQAENNNGLPGTFTEAVHDTGSTGTTATITGGTAARPASAARTSA